MLFDGSHEVEHSFSFKVPVFLHVMQVMIGRHTGGGVTDWNRARKAAQVLVTGEDKHYPLCSIGCTSPDLPGLRWLCRSEGVDGTSMYCSMHGVDSKRPL
jgi:hypothetical protein